VLAIIAIAVAALTATAIMLALGRGGAAQRQLAEVMRMQAESSARMQAVGEMLAGRHAELARAVNDRLDAVSHRLGESVMITAANTADHLQKLHERLVIIDRAQENIGNLSSQVTSLRDVLANKQARGAFGQGRLETIVADALPKGSFAFQFTLKNGKRPDCVIFLPDSRPLVIDAKFPLEAVSALRDAANEDQRRQASARLRQDVLRHVADIADKYLVPGETQDIALMFVPSESVYAELHDSFDDVVQKAYRARVVLVSPALLMLAIQVIRQIQKDARMREAADRIRAEVGGMLGDLGRLRERVVKLEKHFGMANEDIRQILISAEKIDKRATRIEELEFDGEDGSGGNAAGAPAPTPLTLKVAGNS
jgi:DNA recombination protein RmuC